MNEWCPLSSGKLEDNEPNMTTAQPPEQFLQGRCLQQIVVVEHNNNRVQIYYSAVVLDYIPVQYHRPAINPTFVKLFLRLGRRRLYCMYISPIWR